MMSVQIITFCLRIRLNAKLQFPIFSTDDKRPQITFGYDTLAMEVLSTARCLVHNCLSCRGALQIMTCFYNRLCRICGGPVSIKAMTEN